MNGRSACGLIHLALKESCIRIELDPILLYQRVRPELVIKHLLRARVLVASATPTLVAAFMCLGTLLTFLQLDSQFVLLSVLLVIICRRLIIAAHIAAVG